MPSASTAVPEHTEKGSSVIGASPGWAKVVSVSFKVKKFVNTPVVTDIASNNECCGDQFTFTAIDVTQVGFDILVERSDSQSGWGQELAVDWVAFDPTVTTPEATPKDEL